MSDKATPRTDAPHFPAAFINAIAEEGTKTEAVEWLQKIWNERCQFQRDLAAANERADNLNTRMEFWKAAYERSRAAESRLAAIEAAEMPEEPSELDSNDTRAWTSYANKLRAYLQRQTDEIAMLLAVLIYVRDNGIDESPATLQMVRDAIDQAIAKADK